MAEPDFDSLINPFFELNKQTVTFEKEDSKLSKFKELFSDNGAYSSV